MDVLKEHRYFCKWVKYYDYRVDQRKTVKYMDGIYV